jgi:hypothetical protein
MHSDVPLGQIPRSPRTTVVARPGQPAAEATGHNTEILPNLTDLHAAQLAVPGGEFLATPAIRQREGHSDGADHGWMSRIPSNLVIQLGAALVIVALVLIKFG